jgi:hypothetical protein
MKKDIKEHERAFRIQFFTAECQLLITNIYENLVDRDFVIAEKDIKKAITQLRILLKSIEEDDF